MKTQKPSVWYFDGLLPTSCKGTGVIPVPAWFRLCGVQEKAKSRDRDEGGMF